MQKVSRQGVRDLSYIKSTQKNPRIIHKQAIVPVNEIVHSHEWGSWQYGGDGNPDDNSYVRTCKGCHEDQWSYNRFVF